MKFIKKLLLASTIISFAFIISFDGDDAFADELGKVEVEIRYTNGDKVDFTSMKIVVYQDFDKNPLFEKKLKGNPDFIEVPKDHRYKIEVYANDMYADVVYVYLDDDSKKLNINIPLSGGLKFEIFYKNGKTPIEGATVVLRSHNNYELIRDATDSLGETMRYWIQSTIKPDDHYIVDVYLEDIFLTSYFPIKIRPGISFNQKIITNIPEIVDELIIIDLNAGSKKITSTDDGDYKVILSDLQGNNIISSNVDFRGNAKFSNLKSGTYTVKISSNDKIDDELWPTISIPITGDLNKFHVFKNTNDIVKNPKNTIKDDTFFLSCNCIAFRLDDIQDDWLSETQIALIELFVEKNVPLTVGVIGDMIGQDEQIISTLKKNIANESIEIANHGWNNEILTMVDKNTQEKYIIDTNQKIFEIFGITPTSFIPPQNVYDNTAIEILKQSGFTHISSHIDENIFDIDDDLFYSTPAITETAKLINNATEWKVSKKDAIKEKIIQSVTKNGYAVIMMHPQEFSLNDKGEYDVPNQTTLSELSLLLDETKELDSKLVKISEIKPVDGTGEVKPVDEDTYQIDSCNCVAFRLDDIQDYWLNEVQIRIMETFIDNNAALTIGIIANSFGDDQKLVEFIKNNQKKDLEIATKGTGLIAFTDMGENEQTENLQKSIELIESVIDVRPHVFMPPHNKFNSDTLEILEENNISHISSSLISSDSPPFEFKEKEFYRFPQTVSTGKYIPAKNIFEGVSSQQIFDESLQSINNYGFAVISLHSQEFSTIVNSTYVNSINEKQFNELEQLIEHINEKGIKIVPIGKINSSVTISIPDWIKDNAGWWANEQIDDETFVQGIKFLVLEKIINISEKPQITLSDQNIPSWIKNNAGWWANEQIDDETFVQGIEYLVKNNIIVY